jgi:hypothetical protein
MITTRKKSSAIAVTGTNLLDGLVSAYRCLNRLDYQNCDDNRSIQDDLTAAKDMLWVRFRRSSTRLRSEVNSIKYDQLFNTDRVRYRKAIGSVFTVEDPSAFCQPWTAMRRYRRVQYDDIPEIVCAENKQFDYLIPVAKTTDFYRVKTQPKMVQQDGRRGKLNLADLGRADSRPSAFSKRQSRRRSPHR